VYFNQEAKIYGAFISNEAKICEIEGLATCRFGCKAVEWFSEF
jgi:hypothetical protein